MNKEKKILCLKDGDKIIIKKDLKEHLMLFGFSEDHADHVAKIIFLEGSSYVSAKDIPCDKEIKKNAEELMKKFADDNYKNRTPPMLLLKLLFDIIRKVSDHYIVVKSDVGRRYT